MKARINELIKSLSEVFEGEPWYGQSVMRKLENVTYEIGYKTCIPKSHTVSQIVGHLIAWKKFAIEMLKSNYDFEIQKDSEIDWPSLKVSSPEEWEELKRQLVAAQSEIYELLNDLAEDKSLEKNIPGKNFNLDHLIQGIIQHDIYHLGQIGLIESQLKNKTSDSGIFKA